VFDELKNQWGWGGFTTLDLPRCRQLAGTVALVYNWWSLFVRLVDPEHHREAITSRPLLLSTIAPRPQHAGQVALTISSTHGMRDKAHRAYARIVGFLADLRKCGAVGPAGKMMPHSQRGAATLPARTPTSAAHCASARHDLYRRLQSRRITGRIFAQLPNLGL